MCSKTICQWLVPAGLLSGMLRGSLSNVARGLGLLCGCLLIGGSLSSLARGLSLLCGCPLRSLCLLCRLLCCQQRRLACGMLSGVMGDKLGLALLFLGPRRIGNMLGSGCAFRSSLLSRLLAGQLICSSLLFFYRLLHTQPRFFPCLRTRRRKVSIFCTVQIGPGIKRCHVFRRLILVVQRSAISHTSPLNRPRSLPIPRSCQIFIGLLRYGRPRRTHQNGDILTGNRNRTLLTEQ